MLASAGAFSGFGGGFQLGFPEIGVRAVAGYHPTLLSIEEDGENDADLRFFSSFQVSPDVYVAFSTKGRGAFGFQGGYRYDTLYGHGVAVGGYGSFRISKRFEGLVQGGLIVFPRGEERVRDRKRAALPRRFDFESDPDATFGVSLALAMFP